MKVAVGTLVSIKFYEGNEGFLQTNTDKMILPQLILGICVEVIPK